VSKTIQINVAKLEKARSVAYTSTFLRYEGLYEEPLLKNLTNRTFYYVLTPFTSCSNAKYNFFKGFLEVFNPVHHLLWLFAYNVHLIFVTADCFTVVKPVSITVSSGTASYGVFALRSRALFRLRE
jgi:hypothetical protein